MKELISSLPIGNIKEWLDLLSGLLTPIIAVVATMIAIFQYRLERQRWRLGLFEKRYPIYDHTMRFLAAVVTHGNARDEALASFQRDTKDAELLFSKDVSDYLRELYLKGIDLRTATAIMEPLPVGDERTRHAKEIHALSTWFSKQFDVTREIYAPYLQIHEK